MSRRSSHLVSSPEAIAVAGPSVDGEARVEIRVHRGPVDRVYRLVARLAASATLALMALIGAFLLARALPALRAAKWHFLTEQSWTPDSGRFGISAVLLGTVLIAIIALVIAVPLSIGAALFITEYAPRGLRRPITSLVDLLAAVPSLIYGLWGLFFLQPRLIKVSRWLTDHASIVPFFRTKSTNYASTTFIAGVVVALMIVPICTAVMREVFSQAPPGEKEGALALGGTRWGWCAPLSCRSGGAGSSAARCWGWVEPWERPSPSPSSSRRSSSAAPTSSRGVATRSPPSSRCASPSPTPSGSAR